MSAVVLLVPLGALQFGPPLCIAAPLQEAVDKPNEAVPQSESDDPGYDDDTATASEGEGSLEEAPQKKEPKPLPPPKNAKRLDPEQSIWIDPAKHIVYLDGRISLNEGFLELFACPRGSKDHESIVAVDCRPSLAHAALLNVGAEAGSPVKFRPKYEAATGTIIDISVSWLDAKGKWQHAKAQEWVRQIRSEKELTADWVFAGSGFWVDDDNEPYYMADAGELICLSNLPSAMLDLPIRSSDSNEELLFEAFTERIPALGTPVRISMTPREKEKKPKDEAKTSELEPTKKEAESTD